MKFQPGQSGNPAGRKPGTKNKKLELLRSNDEKLQRKVLSMALDGDPTALRICADRLWPKIRPEAVPIKIDADASNLADTGRSVIAAALAGRITPDTLRDLLTALSGMARITEITDLEKRLVALEEAPGKPPPWLQSKKGLDQPLPLRGKKRGVKK